jgi:hypothetical protein
MPVTDDPNTRYGLVVPHEALRAALRVDNRVRKLLRIDVYAVSSDGQVRAITGAGNQLHELGDRGTPLATGPAHRTAVTILPGEHHGASVRMLAIRVATDPRINVPTFVPRNDPHRTNSRC